MNRHRLLLALTAAVLIPACGDSAGGGALTQSPTLKGFSIQDISVGVDPTCLLVADINNTLGPDILVGSSLGVQFIRSNGAGVMSAALVPPGGDGEDATSLALGLLNGDALPDLVVGLGESSGVQVYLNTGDANTPYNTFTLFPVSSTAPVAGIALVDVDGDLLIDLVTANPAEHSVSVLLGDGNGAFGAATDYAAGLGARFVASADFNGDGNADLVTANEAGDSVSVILGTGATPAFGAPTFLPTGDQPRCISLQDFTGDGRIDLAVVCWVSSELLVFPGRANGTFGTPIVTEVSTGHAWVTSGDVNDDSRPDLMILGANLFNPIFLAGRGNGTFLPLIALTQMDTPVTVNASQVSGGFGDFNGDGLLDLAIAFGTAGGSTVTVRVTDTVTP